jgi:hypothetical protein
MSSINFAEELKVVGEYKSFPFGKGQPPMSLPKFNTPITPKENFHRYMKGENPLWVPTGIDILTFCPRIVPDNVARAFVFDVDPIDNVTEGGGKDWFDVEWEYVPQVNGSMVRPGNPLKVPDINEWEKYLTFPNLDDMDWEGSAARNKEVIASGRVLSVWLMNGLFERLISFMEFENAAVALIDDDKKDAVHRLFDALANFYDDVIARFKKYYDADILYFHDDWGSQRSPFFSLRTAREMLVPYLKRIVDSAHKHGMYVDFHSCGKVEKLVPAMIDAGVDIWSGQPMNDRLAVLKEHGDKIKLNFGPAMEFGAPEDVQLKAYEEYFDTYGDYLTSLIISGFGAGPKVYEYVYKRTREALAK